VKKNARVNLLNISSGYGNGYAMRSVTLFKCLKYTVSLRDLSFFRNKQSDDAHGELNVSCIFPASNISSIIVSNSAAYFIGMRRSFRGGVFGLI
jgi:hypothetical protein